MNNKGFTLIEIILVVVILGVLIGGVILALNPAAQLAKSRDANRLNDLSQIKDALNVLYSDTNCYPDDQSVTFGEELSVNDEVYMQELPQDPLFQNDSSYEYRYTADPNCSQWFAIFTKLEELEEKNSCSLDSSCQPANFSGSCIVEGIVDCDIIRAASF